MTKNSVKEDYIDAHSKSMFLSVILCVFFGPVGAMYASVVLGLAFLILTIAASIMITAMMAATYRGNIVMLSEIDHTAMLSAMVMSVMIIIWFLSIMVSCFVVVQHNVKVKAYANLHG